MINLEINENQKSGFPYIGISKSGTIVLFIDHGKGFALKSRDGMYYSETWQQSNFSIFDGTIALNNVGVPKC